MIDTKMSSTGQIVRPRPAWLKDEMLPLLNGEVEVEVYGMSVTLKVSEMTATDDTLIFRVETPDIAVPGGWA